MNRKRMNQLFNIIGLLVGAVLGYFRPMFFQNYLPIMGIVLGLFYFFSTNSVNKNPNKKRITDYNGYLWYSFYKVMIGFLIGGTLLSTIVLSIDVIQGQQAMFTILLGIN